MAIPINDREFLRPVDAQELFGISKSKFWNWAKDKNFPVFKPDGGRTSFVRRLDVEQFIRTGRPVERTA